jgi:arginyl-tRNA synthetase
MIQQTLAQTIREAAVAAAPELGLDPADVPEPELSHPKIKEHGDWATNVALILASRAGKPPRVVAEAVARRLGASGGIQKVEVAGPGFINLFLDHGWLHDVLRQVLERGPAYGRGDPKGQRVQIEYVSANPTGPLHVGTARNAAIGDSLANVLDAAGYAVEREYYYNDAGRQMEMFGRSVEARLLQLEGHPAEVPEDGYHGEYVLEVARQIAESVTFDPPLSARPPEERWRDVLEHAVPIVLNQIEATLKRFRVVFDSYKREQEFRESGAIDDAVAKLRRAGYAYDADGAVWFKSTAFGDDKDRVLIRSNGEPTYFAADCAYLLDKAARGFDRLIYVWGADHHGDVKRVTGAAEALGVKASIDIVLYQFVSLFRGGEPVRMSKRTGEIITLDELLDEVGPDAARYTLLTRSSDSPLDFDIEAVTRQSLDNPVYYVQYAHARIASVLRVAEERGVQLRPWQEADFGTINEEAELELLRTLSELPSLVELAAETPVPHRLTRYAEEVAAAFHHFYAECRVISDDAARTQSRLWLSVATKQVIGTALALIGVSAPESMDRLGDGDE